MKARLCAFCGLLLLACIPCAAEDALVLRDDPGEYPLGLHFFYLEDPTAALTISQVDSPDLQGRFTPLGGRSNDFGVTDSAYWLRLTIRNESASTSWVLKSEYLWLGVVELYLPDGSGSFRMRQARFSDFFRKQGFKTSTMALDFTVDGGKEETLYVRVRSSDQLILSFTLLSVKRFFAADHENQLLYGLYYGVMAIMVIYNFALFFFARDRAFIYLAGMVFFICLHQLQENGLYYEYLAPHVTRFITYGLYTIFWCLDMGFSILFARTLLSTRTYTPVIHVITHVLLGLCGLSICLDFLIPTWIIDLVNEVLSYTIMIAGIVLGIVSHLKGNRLARLFLIGYGTPIIGSAIASLAWYGAIPFRAGLINLDQLWEIFSIVFFSLILGSRYRLLRQDKEMAERLNDQQTSFFINLTHEIKTPLTLISGYLDEYIRAHGRSAALGVVAHNVEKLRGDMLSFFDLLKFKKGKLVYQHDSILDMRRFMEQKVELFRSPASARGIRIDYQGESPLYIRADRLALERIANNLLENAVRYNRDNGTIRVSLSSRGGAITLSVENTGDSIDPEHLSHIFEPFFQLSRAKRSAQGIGMGLAIVKEIVGSLGGRIEARNLEGEGSAFTVTLKRFIPREGARVETEEIPPPGIIPSLPPPVEPAAKRVQEGAAHAHTILLVEDNRDLLALMKARLAESYAILTAGNGKEALQALHALADASLPDMIVSDVMMDEMDGYGLLRAVRQEPRLDGVYFVFITARTGEEERLSGLRSGAVDYIEKPFVMEELVGKISALMRLRDAEEKIHAQERLASLGMLLGSISHEIFNPLSGIKGPLANARKLISESGLAGDARLEKHLSYIEESVSSIEGLIKTMTALLSEGPLETGPVDLNGLMDEVWAAGHRPGKSVTLIRRIPQGTTLTINRDAAFHVLRNITANSVEAIDSAGTVTCAFQNGTITICDDGRGMDRAVLTRAFEPLFTTKDGSRGIGLGLPMVRNLCDRMGWKITVDSTPGQGTTVTLVLP